MKTPSLLAPLTEKSEGEILSMLAARPDWDESTFREAIYSLAEAHLTAEAKKRRLKRAEGWAVLIATFAGVVSTIAAVFTAFHAK